MKIRVGHLRRHYLPPTETFIYSVLANARRSRPHVFAETLMNHGRFPVACTYLIEQKELSQARRKLGGQFSSFRRSLLGRLDYPNCYERQIRRKGIRLLHAHFATEGWAALRLRSRLKLPLITSFHGFDASRLLGEPVWRRRLSQLFSAGDAFLVVGNGMKRRLEDAGCPEDKVHVLHVGISVDNIPFRLRSRPQRGRPTVLLFCGRLVEKKGVLYALDAFARLADDWPALTFRIAGDGPLRHEAEQTVLRLGLGHRVRLLGTLEHAAVLAEMAKAHVLVLPSATARDGDMEGAPVVLMEAQASGLPVLSTHHADIPEVVLDGKSGHLVPEHDPQALADGLDRMLRNPHAWAALGRAGRRHIERHYDIRRQVDALEETYARFVA